MWLPDNLVKTTRSKRWTFCLFCRSCLSDEYVAFFFRLPFLRFKHTKGAKERSFWSDSTKRNAQKGWKELTLILTKRYRTQHTKSNAYSNQTVQKTKQNKTKSSKKGTKRLKSTLIWTREYKTQHTKAASKKKKGRKRLKRTLIWTKRYKTQKAKNNAYSNQTVQNYALSGWNKHSFKLFVRFYLVSPCCESCTLFIN